MAKRKSSAQRSVEKAVKKTHGLTIFFAILFLVIGVVGGWFAYTTVTKNDTFEVVGEKEITIELNGSYTELGCKIIAWGKDESSNVKIDSDLDVSAEGTYYICYTIDNFKYKDIKKVRIVNVVNPNAEV